MSQKAYRFRKGTSDFSTYKEVFLNRCYEKAGFRIEKSDIWLDLGGNIGMFAEFCYRRGAAVAAIYEPFLKNYEQIVYNTRGHILQISMKAVTNKSKTMDLFVCEDGNFKRNTLFNHYKKKKMSTVKVKTVAFTDIIFDDCCVKMDIEGAEFEILDGCELSDLQRIKKLVFEYHFDVDSNLDNYFRRIEKLKKAFKNVNYHKMEKAKTMKSLKIFPTGHLVFCWGRNGLL